MQSIEHDKEKRSAENWDYYTGDTFCYWTGPMPPKNHPKYGYVRAHLKKIYHSHNVIKPAIIHYVSALIGKPFNWYLSANGERIKGTNQTEELLQKWWDNQQRLSQDFSPNNSPLIDAILQMLITDDCKGIGRGYLRLYTPKRLKSAKEPWQKIVLHCPEIGSVTPEFDDDGFLYKATYSYCHGTETYTILESGKTLIEGDEVEAYEVDMGGNLPIFEFKGQSLLTADVKECQNSINKTLTIKDENLNTAGFLERILLNAQLPGSWINDPSAPGGERFIPDQTALEFGANKVVYVQGIPIGDPKSPSGYTTPSIQYRQPVDASAFLSSLDIDYTSFYRAIGLGHLLSAGEGRMSGISRETIKQDWETKLHFYAQAIESKLEAIFSSVLLLLSENSSYSPKIQLSLATGEPLPEERRANREDFGAGLLSKVTAMSRAGIEDPDAELELINREKQEDLQALTQQQNFLASQQQQV